MKAVFLNDAAGICTLGDSLVQIEQQLFQASPAELLTVSDRYSPGHSLPLGAVNTELPPIEIREEDSRNNRLLAAATSSLLPVINELKGRVGRNRIGIVLGTSTSGIAEGEAALSITTSGPTLEPEYSYTTQEFSAPARFLSRWLDLGGPCFTLSSACTSGGKALAAAARLLKLGICDAVLAGGVDSLCRMTIGGFSSLMVTAATPCNPFSVNRCGTHIGEGAAVFLMTREPQATDSGNSVRLAGWGETSDAHHISSPHPEGRGAIAAMYHALSMAALEPPHIDYINLHGTATRQNDQMEAIAVHQVFGSHTPCSSTKPLTGHTLAAAGAIEALLCWLLLQRDDGQLPPHHWDGQADPALPAMSGLAGRRVDGPIRAIMSNSFAFGGNNLSLILSREVP